jgi:hypothetical protein
VTVTDGEDAKRSDEALHDGKGVRRVPQWERTGGSRHRLTEGATAVWYSAVALWWAASEAVGLASFSIDGGSPGPAHEERGWPE